MSARATLCPSCGAVPGQECAGDLRGREHHRSRAEQSVAQNGPRACKPKWIGANGSRLMRGIENVGAAHAAQSLDAVNPRLFGFTREELRRYYSAAVHRGGVKATGFGFYAHAYANGFRTRLYELTNMKPKDVQ